jgi:iron complex outermembrane receptor protein
LRVNTDFDSSFNGTAGLFYQDSYAGFTTEVATNRRLTPLFPVRLSWYTIDMNIKSIAPFAQLRWKPIEKLEIAAGARWTDDKRRQTQWNRNTAGTFSAGVGPMLLVIPPTPKIRSKTWQPELTVTYKPTEEITVFGSLKKGHKSGSFNVGAVPSTTLDNAYGDETVKGGEVGVKSRLLDRRLQLEVAAYNYKYSGLQVGVIEPAPGGVPQVRTVNAGSSRTYGVDFSAVYRPPQIEHLALNLNGEYNHGRFKVLNNVPCWGGQTIAEGCNQFLSPATGLFTAQNLNGTRLPRAPDWQLNFGFDYEWPLADGRTFIISNTNAYYSRYVYFPGTRADFFQSGFIKSDLSFALRGPNDHWELALIGKNITDKITGGSCSNANYENGSILLGQVTGGTTRGPAGVDEVGCRADRGREVWVRLTLKPFN